ncbi:L-rhamnose mutarotase [Belliella kenyensis]|uniref:L-rhamnose mutarotase n=2 Tax=Belliella kenyensis TaxID=1472724 RepID=A0ABV8EJZ0_9BACT|nr:L-rhamnose mutarotase [Belliella kenyensis]MCH7401350.1 L-rhamnose mutarotase [Belliella kenyensis]MDN3602793.1 L-rhamnose mutarotase [Belliella kenyensis]
MKKHYLAIDLKDDPQYISAYEDWHKESWPEIKQSIFESGINSMEIFRTGNRLVMVIETEPNFSFIKKAQMDASNHKVQEWETIMNQYQEPLPWAKEGDKWTIMKRIFHLSKPNSNSQNEKHIPFNHEK